MGKTVKIGISLPQEVLEAAEQERQARGQSRSEFFCRAVEAVLRQQKQQEAIERYIRGYQEYPETDHEILAAQQSGLAVLSQEPWE